MNKATLNAMLMSLCLILSNSIYSQSGITLNEVINMAKLHSLKYRENENKFLSDYMSYRQYRLGLLPKISLDATPFSINRSLSERYDYENNIETFRESKILSNNSGLNISQKIAITGGNLSMGSSFSRIENFGESNYISYSTAPFRISYSQPLFAHNPYSWEKREMPLNLKLAKLKLLESEQELTQEVVKLYFDLLKASQLYELAQQELENSDTLLNSGKALMELKTITPNELVELELKNTNAKVLLAQKEQELVDANYELNRILRVQLPANEKPVLIETVPDLMLDPNQMILFAQDSNPFYIEIEKERINLEKSIDQAEKQGRFSANLNFSYGLNQGGKTIKEALGKPLNQETGSVSFSLPILNWGENKDKLLLAKIDKEMSELQIQTRIADFEQNILKKVAEYNINKEMIKQTAKSKELTLKTYNTKMQQYTLGQITLQELNQTQVEVLRTKENHLESITRFWINYYELQKITLHDIKTDQALTTDFDRLISMFKN
jgi:outer membrane protein TolC